MKKKSENMLSGLKRKMSFRKKTLRIRDTEININDLTNSKEGSGDNEM